MLTNNNLEYNPVLRLDTYNLLKMFHVSASFIDVVVLPQQCVSGVCCLICICTQGLILVFLCNGHYPEKLKTGQYLLFLYHILV